MSDGPLISAEQYWADGWRGPTVFRASGGRLRPVSSVARPDVALPGTLFPRLTDHHVHLGLIEPGALMPGGITDVDDLGWIADIAASWAEQATGDTRVPGVRFAGGFITCVGGYPSASGWAPAASVIEVSTTEQAGDAVAEMHELGASFIKLTLNSDAGPVLDDDVLSAIVEVAQEFAGLPVVAHAQGPGQAARAFDAGVNGFAHAPFSERLDDRLIGRMARDMFWISTLDIHGWGDPAPEFDVTVDNVSRFVAAGGRILYGTDLGNGPLPAGVNERELRAFARAGLDRDALVRTIAGSQGPAAFGPRFAWVPGLPPESADETARWLAGARGSTVETLKETLA